MQCMQCLWSTEEAISACVPLLGGPRWLSAAQRKYYVRWCVVQWEVCVCVCVRVCMSVCVYACMLSSNEFLCISMQQLLVPLHLLHSRGAFLVFPVESAWMKYDVWTAVF